MFDAQLTSHDDSSKGESAPHVDGAVVEGHGCGLALGEQLRDETETDRILCGLCSGKADPGSQQLPKAVHLHHTTPMIIAGTEVTSLVHVCWLRTHGLPVQHLFQVLKCCLLHGCMQTLW